MTDSVIYWTALYSKLKVVRCVRSPTDTYEDINGEMVALDMSTQWMDGADQNPLYDFAVAANVSFVYDKYKTNVYHSDNAGLIPGADYDGLTKVHNKFWYYHTDYRRDRKRNGRNDQPLAVVMRKFSKTLTDPNE